MVILQILIGYEIQSFPISRRIGVQEETKKIQNAAKHLADNFSSSEDRDLEQTLFDEAFYSLEDLKDVEEKLRDCVNTGGHSQEVARLEGDLAYMRRVHRLRSGKYLKKFHLCRQDGSALSLIEEIKPSGKVSLHKDSLEMDKLQRFWIVDMLYKCKNVSVVIFFLSTSRL